MSGEEQPMPSEASTGQVAAELDLEELEAEIDRAEELHGELSRRLDAAGRD
ncbi:hypothetical protein [Nesterenkonia halophila]|uniref:hypothetical protein n=1 Tax=Nesterenkonia halophila TaxID=302044 RepID=UPI001292B800|nr:hypothetical protein [Nesterenkonia halophila]